MCSKISATLTIGSNLAQRKKHIVNDPRQKVFYITARRGSLQKAAWGSHCDGQVAIEPIMLKFPVWEEGYLSRKKRERGGGGEISSNRQPQNQMHKHNQTSKHD